MDGEDSARAVKSKQSETDFQLLWKMSFAWQSFMHVVETCHYIEDHNIQEDSPVHYSLMVGIVTLYSRPFKRSHGMTPLPSAMIPEGYQTIHATLLLARDKIMAHSDSNMPAIGAVSPNHVRLRVEADKPVTLLVGNLRLGDLVVQMVCELAEILVEKTSYHIRRLGKRIGGANPSAPGEYILDFDQGKFLSIAPLPDEE